MTIDDDGDEIWLTLNQALELVDAALAAAERMALEDIPPDERPALKAWLDRRRPGRLSLAKAMLIEHVVQLH